MRHFKLLIISFVVLFLIVTIISLFIPSHIRISKAVNISASADSVMAQIKDPAKWKGWYPGIDTVQYLYKNGVVKGVILDNKDSLRPVFLEIIKVQTDEVTAQFVTPNMRPVVNGWKTFAYPSSDSVTLQWYMDFHLRWYPWEKFKSLLLEGAYGSKMERGLFNLRKSLQSN